MRQAARQTITGDEAVKAGSLATAAGMQAMVASLRKFGGGGGAGGAAGSQFVGADTAVLSMAGRPFERGTRLSDRVGRNEKTKIIVQLSGLSLEERGAAAAAATAKLAAERAELRALKPSELKRRARVAGVSEIDLEESDDADSPKEAVLDLLLAALNKPLGGAGGGVGDGAGGAAVTLKEYCKQSGLTTTAQPEVRTRSSRRVSEFLGFSIPVHLSRVIISGNVCVSDRREFGQTELGGARRRL